jgi:hypothetical protein
MLDIFDCVGSSLMAGGFSGMANAQEDLSPILMNGSFLQRLTCKQLYYPAVESNTSAALRFGDENHARDQLLNKKPWVVAFIRSLLHQKGLARYLCIAHALASMLHILIEASFHMCVPYVHWHEDGGSWGSGELTQWLSNRHVFHLKWPESILAYCY